MRTRHIIAVAAAILVGAGVKLIFFAAPTADADSRSISSARMDVSQMHRNITILPVHEFHDMSLVFPGGH